MFFRESFVSQNIRFRFQQQSSCLGVDGFQFTHQQVKLDFSRPGKPTDNAVAESFLASPRRECLTSHWFIDLEEAQDQLENWREDYNNVRPHRSLGGKKPDCQQMGTGGLPR